MEIKRSGDGKLRVERKRRLERWKLKEVDLKRVEG